MDDLLREFLTETRESLDRVDAELAGFEQEPNNRNIIGNIFRLVHTIKGTCGFLGLSRLGALAPAATGSADRFSSSLTSTACSTSASGQRRERGIGDGISSGMESGSIELPNRCKSSQRVGPQTVEVRTP
jgi:two-component system, chemotaxis family, sensor kinase CheA